MHWYDARASRGRRRGRRYAVFGRRRRGHAATLVATNVTPGLGGPGG